MSFNRLIKIPTLIKITSNCLNKQINNNYLIKQTTILTNKRYQSTTTTTSNNDDDDDLNKREQESLHESEESIEEVILKAALKYVPEVGFSTEAISRAANECGLSSASKGIFSNGAFDLIDYFYKSSNKDLSNYLENLVKDGKIKGKNQLIREALVYRLGLIQPYIKHWPEAMAIQTFNPSYAIVAIENLLRLCDEIWHQVGDSSTDINWYTKRLTLAAVYKSTELFMIQDKSENFIDTYEFLDNRFNDLAQFNKFKTQLSNLNQAVTGSLTVMRNVLKLRN